MNFLGLFAMLILHVFSESLASNATNETNAFLAMLKLGIEGCPAMTFCTLEKKNTGPSRWKSCCDQCSCETFCRVNQNCCPDAPIQPTSTTDSMGGFQQETECRTVFLENEHYNKFIKNAKGAHFQMITRCPDGTSCLPVYNNGNISNLSDDDLTVVLDEAAHITYVNNKCADCNGARSISRFNFMISYCTEHLSVDSVKHEDFKLHIYQKCAILSKPSKHQESFLVPCIKDVIDTCNQTGQWDVYDPLLEQMCLDPYSNFYAYHPKAVYKNVYCVVCNLGYVVNTAFCFDKDILASFHEVFKIRRDIVDRGVATRPWRCKESEIYDHAWNVCRHVYCPPLHASSRGTCTPLPIELQIDAVTLYLRLYPVDINGSTDFGKEDTPIYLRNSAYVFEDISNQLGIETCINKLRQIYMFDASLQAPFHQSNHTSLYMFYILGLTAERNCTYETVARCVTKLINEPLKTVVDIQGVSKEFFVTYFEPPVPEKDDVSLEQLIQPDDFKSVIAAAYEISIGLKSRTGIYNVKMQRPFFCPYIILNRNEYCSPTNKDQREICNFPEFIDKISIPKLTYGHNFSSDRVYKYYYKICLKDYFPMIGHPTGMLTFEGTKSRTSGIVSLSVTSASLLCILVSLRLIYKQGQSSNSRLITIASQMSLFAALASFQFLSGWTKHTTLCMVSGIMVHYFWLSYVFVSGTYFMTVDFNLQNVTNLKQYSTHIALAVVLSFVTPALFVVVNMLYTRSKFGGSSLGYNASFGTCLISTSLMRGLTFVAPILTTVLVNIIIFIHLVIRIRRISSDFYISNGRKYYATYVRLLILVGIAWLLGFLNEFVRSPVIDYTFIILVCGQGMWSMFSMLSVHYKQIFSTYLASWRKAPVNKTGSSQN